MTNFLRKDVSLSEVHGSIDTTRKGSWWRQLFVFFGPAYLVSVGYMDPGNLATDLAGGSQFGYSLLWVLMSTGWPSCSKPSPPALVSSAAVTLHRPTGKPIPPLS